MREWLRKRPWIWLILLYLFVVGVNAVVVWIAERNPAVPVEDAPELPG